MDDLIDEMFSAVDVYYPGSKRKRKEYVKVERAKDIQEKSWDSRPYIKPLNGKDVEFFTLGALAEALGRPIITVRTWIANGYMPVSTYRLPDVIDKNGDTRKGRWLYTRDMITTAVEIFAAHGLLDSVRIEWSSYKNVPQELSTAWGNLRIENN